MNGGCAVAEHNTVDISGFDEEDYQSITRDGARIEEMAKGDKELATFEEFYEDVFHGVNKYAPKLRDEVLPRFRVNRGLVETAMQTSEYRALKRQCQGHPDLSAVAAMAVAKAVMGGLSDAAKEDLNQAIKEEEQAEQDGQEAADLFDGPAGQAVTRNLNEIQGALSRAMGEAAEEAKENQEVLSAWGLGPGTEDEVPWKERFELANAIRDSRALQNIAQVLGRMRRLALRSVPERTRGIPPNVVGIGRGNALERMTSAGITQLATPGLEVLFYRDYAQNNVEIYDVEGDQPKAKGPIIACIDQSGSMVGERDVWAKAVALALMHVAQKEKRPWHGIAFSSRGDVRTYSVPAGASRVDAARTAMQFASHFFGGGTCFDTAIGACLEAFNERPELEKGDVVFVTDGECIASPEVLTKLEWEKGEKQFQVVGVQIGSRGESGLTAIADRVVPGNLFQELDDVAAQEVFKLCA